MAEKDYVRTLRRTDALMLMLTVAAAQLIRFGLDNGTLHMHGLSLPYGLVGALLGVTWWVWLDLRGTRDIRLVGHGVEESKEVVNATLILFGAVAIISYALDVPTARGYVVVALPLGVLLLHVGRGRIRKQLGRRHRQGIATSRTMIIGCQPAVVETVKSLRAHPEVGFDQ